MRSESGVQSLVADEATREDSALDSADVQTRLRDLEAYLESKLIGGSALVERLLIGLLAGGHILVEGSPGLAKTRVVKLLAKGLHAPFARIQCTPDLMPADLTGGSIFRPDSGTFEFVPGPIFHSLVLVDEVNRAPPKVQSALLEAMAEHQVTAAGITHHLPEPFMVVATQNPIEHEGTFPLPEAQLDRFMMKIEVSLPDRHIERQILDLVEGETQGAQGRSIRPIGPAEIAEAQKVAMTTYLSPAVKDYIVRLVTAPREADTHQTIAEKIAHPASPRGTLALAAAAKARAYLAGRDHVIPDDVADLALDILSHRTILTWRALAEGHTPRRVVGEVLERVHPV
jgi:MoxR-like ATPase